MTVTNGSMKSIMAKMKTGLIPQTSPPMSDAMLSGTPLSRSERNRIVDLGGVACLLGYATLAFYSRQTVVEPTLGVFFTLLAWVAVPVIVVFARFRRRLDDLPVGRLLFWAVLFRACGLFGIPLFEDDYFRYLWDGYRFAETGTPYGWTPLQSFTDLSVPPVFQRILDQVNYPDLPTIYGPTTEYVFLLSYFLKPGSLVPLQLLLIGVDLLLIRMLLALAPSGCVLLYAWCPLVVREIAFTAHPDGLGVCLLIAALLLGRDGRMAGAAACLALAAGAKVFALLLTPFILARAGRGAWLVFGIVLGMLYLPFAVQGGTDLVALAVFARAWEFNAALYGVLTLWLADLDTRLILGTVLLALGTAYWLRHRRASPGTIPRGDWVYGAFLLAAPVINPWYVIWILPFAAIFPTWWAWTASLAVFLSYVTGANIGAFDMDPFAQPWWVRPLEFGLILAALCVDGWRRYRRGTLECEPVIKGEAEPSPPNPSIDSRESVG